MTESENKINIDSDIKKCSRIMLVDDDEDLLILIKRVLKKQIAGVEIMSASGGEQALEIMSNNKPDIAVIDFIMPGIDGVHLVNHIKSDPRLSDMEIIFLSGMEPDDPRLEQARELNVTRIMDKSVILEDLAPAISKILADKNPACEEAKTAETPAGNDEAVNNSPAQLENEMRKNENPAPDSPAQNVDTKSIFDIDQTLRMTDNDYDLLKEIFVAYIDDTPRQIEKLKLAISSGNGGESERISHSLKGSAANIGAQLLRGVALEVESASRNGRLDIADSLMPDVEKQWIILVKELKKFISTDY